jgi:hypothetical protein
VTLPWATALSVFWLASPPAQGAGAGSSARQGVGTPADPPVTCSVTFLNDHPSQGAMGWTDANQGVAHDDGHWFFTNEEQIIKIPVDLDVATEIDPDDSETWPAGVRVRSMPQSLVDAGWEHFGDLDQAHGFLFIPINRVDGGPYPHAAIAVFRTADLSYVGVAEFNQDRPSFAAINPTNGLLYMSSWLVDTAHPLRKYKLKFDQIDAGDVQGGIVLEPDPFTLRDWNDAQITYPFEHTQGAAFTPWGDLYLVNGLEGETVGTYRGGVHLFNAAGTLIGTSLNGGGVAINFVYDPTCSLTSADLDCEEPEGADWWNRNAAPSSPHITGQLHVMLNDNDASDDLYFKHYEVALCHPSQDFDSDGLTDQEESFDLATNPVRADTDGDGVSDGAEVNVLSTDPLQPDSDGDGIADGAEDADGDGLSNGEELGTWHSDPVRRDTDGDGLSDGDEVHVHGTDPLKAETDAVGLTDAVELGSGTNPVDADSDDDGLPDGGDVEFIENVVNGLPSGAFATPALRATFIARLEAIELQIAAGHRDSAIAELGKLGLRVDGCGGAADGDDWIVVCPSQLQIRSLIGLLAASLAG